MTTRQVINKIHLWLGLTSGLVVFILGVTGCLYAFHSEITHWTRHDLRHADVVGKHTLPVAELEKRLAHAMGVERLPFGLATFRDPTRNWQAYTLRESEGSWSYFGNIDDFRTGYINPYTGQVAGIVNEEEDFFAIVKGIHWSLLLADDIGQPIVVGSTVIFLVSMLTGFFLWLPRRWRRIRWRQHFGIHWKATWKRLNHDLHNVFGFYALLALLAIGFTGLWWYVPAAQKTLNLMAGGGFSTPVFELEPVPGEPPPAGTGTSPMARAYATAWSRFPQADMIILRQTPPGADEPGIWANILPTEGTYRGQHWLWFDGNNGQLVKQAGEFLSAVNYDIHVGSIGGFWTKLLAFFASLVAAGLPVTGFLYWYPGWRRKRRSRKRHGAALANPAPGG